MTTTYPGSHQGQPARQLPILATSFDGFLAQAEQDLRCRRREVRALRQRARRQRRREIGLLRRTASFVGKASAVTLSIAGIVALLAGTILLVFGNFDTAKDAFALSAAAWGATTAVCAPRGSYRNQRFGGPHGAVAAASSCSRDSNGWPQPDPSSDGLPGSRAVSVQ
ncbi:hypothetical protein ABZZ79_32285 [Streptomyces sp. NPDC006458]|uniref:hypothetical protein n=1 Tax=Streptomyces sp. NPDC006458 TaxID=3154302 RepID=UPI00339DAA5A